MRWEHSSRSFACPDIHTRMPRPMSLAYVLGCAHSSRTHTSLRTSISLRMRPSRFNARHSEITAYIRNEVLLGGPTLFINRGLLETTIHLSVSPKRSHMRQPTDTGFLDR